MSQLNRLWPLLGGLTLMLFLAACSAIPGPAPTVVSPLVSPVEEPTTTPGPPELPTPKPGTATIYGRMATKESSPVGRAFTLPGASIFLAEMHYAKNETGTPTLPIARLEQAVDPNVPLVPGQYFVFTAIEPGEYAFVLVNPVEQYVVPGDDPLSGFMVVEVAAGETVDVGEIALP